MTFYFTYTPSCFGIRAGFELGFFDFQRQRGIVIGYGDIPD